MSSVRIKICGITSARDAALCQRAGADYLGFVFTRASPRCICPEAAGEIIRGLAPGIIPVGVFVNPTASEVRRTVTLSGVRMVQLSGDEPPSFCERISLPVIKVVRKGQVPPPADYRVFALMVDGAAEGKFGGTGVPADRAFAASCSSLARCFLAGGLDDSNVVQAAMEVSPFAVDAATGTETRPGMKDPVKVDAFCRAIHEYNTHQSESTPC